MTLLQNNQDKLDFFWLYEATLPDTQEADEERRSFEEILNRIYEEMETYQNQFMAIDTHISDMSFLFYK